MLERAGLYARHRATESSDLGQIVALLRANRKRIAFPDLSDRCIQRSYYFDFPGSCTLGLAPYFDYYHDSKAFS